MLGGGGPLGRARHWGLAAGLLEAGIDLRDADLIIGTSAGAVIGAMLALGGDPRDSALAVDAYVASPNTMSALHTMMEGCARATRSSNPEAKWKAVGRMAWDAPTIDENTAVSRPSLATIAGRAWPANYRATAVDAYTGKFKSWSADDRVPLERAVASSAALPFVWQPITIGDGRYVDGGVRSMLNADLARGHSRVLVISNFVLTTPADAPESTRIPNEALVREIESLQRAGSMVEVITPDAAFLELTAHGARMIDNLLVPQAYAICKRQGLRELDRIRRLWNVSG